jgi:hypothetical protein
MTMQADEKMPAIRRDILAVYEHVERARDMIKRKADRAAWNELDTAVARLQGLMMFIGPWKDEATDADAGAGKH